MNFGFFRLDILELSECPHCNFNLDIDVNVG